MFRYFKKIDKQINETLNIYQELGRMSLPFFKYILFIISFLVVTSCIAILLSFFSESSISNDSNAIWINYSLPIIIYGITCPVISTVISSIFKLFLESQINNIKNKHRYIYKKSGKYPSLRLEIYNICKFIIFSKNILIVPFSFTLLLLPIDVIYIYILMSILIVFSILLKLSLYYDSFIDCNIIGIEKCHNDKEIYYRYCMEVQYPNEDKRLIKKRFTDFKKLHNKLDYIETLPTSNWIIKPNTFNDAENRGKQLNMYMKHILGKKENMTNSLFYSFFKEEEKVSNKPMIMENNPLILEKDQLSNIPLDPTIEEDTHINNLELQLLELIEDKINGIYILHEINYFTVLKKRFFVVNDYFLYKIRFDRIRKQFSIRRTISLSNIFKVEKTIIVNTNEFLNKELVIIYYQLDNEIHQLLLISVNTNLNYNINGIFHHLKEILKENCSFIISEKYELDVGYGITETIVHNPYIKNAKNIMVQNLIYTWSFFDK